MAIKLPSSWRTRISGWRWVILVWTIDIGGIILDVIDWFLGWVNWGIYQAEQAWNKAVAAWDKAVEEARALGKRIDKEVDKLLGKINAWWAQLDDWWGATYHSVKEWVRTLVGRVEDTLTDLQRLFNNLALAWEDFKRSTLPKLLDFSWVTTFFGKGISRIDDWWLPTRQKLEDSLSAITGNIISEVNQINKKLADWGGFFANPWQWLQDKFADWFLGVEK